MHEQIYAIKDEKAEFFHKPFFLKTQVEAVRLVMDEVNNPKSQLANHTDDFALYILGTFQEDTGTIVPQINGPKRITELSVLKTTPQK